MCVRVTYGCLCLTNGNAQPPWKNEEPAAGRKKGEYKSHELHKKLSMMAELIMERIRSVPS